MAILKKGSAKAKAWGAKMKRLRMKGNSSRPARRKTTSKLKKRSVSHMARRKKSYRRRTPSIRSASNSLMHGVFKPKGIILSLIHI